MKKKKPFTVEMLKAIAADAAGGIRWLMQALSTGIHWLPKI